MWLKWKPKFFIAFDSTKCQHFHLKKEGKCNVWIKITSRAYFSHWEGINFAQGLIPERSNCYFLVAETGLDHVRTRAVYQHNEKLQMQ